MGNLSTIREAESRESSKFLARIEGGPAGLVFEGAAGIGKTTVWLETIRRATESSFCVLTARASAAEAKLSYAALADLLATLEPALFDQLPPVQRVALDRVLLRGHDGPDTDEHAAAAAFLSVLRLLAQQSPVLVAIDDLQWLDSPSRAVVAFAARRLTGRVGITATIRTDDKNPVPSWLHLPHPDQLTRMTLGPLSLGGLHGVIKARLGRTLSRPVITRIHQVSGGNPFYALELARALDDSTPLGRLQLPASLNEVVRQHIGTVDEKTSQLLLAASCAANPTVVQLAQVTRTTVDDTIHLLEHAETQGIITLDGNRLQFTHPLLAHGIYTAARAAQRRAMHRKLAELTEVPELRAGHLAQAAVTADETTLQAIDAAVDAVAARGAPSAAAELLDLAISLGGDNPVRRLRAAEQHFRAGSFAKADDRLQSIMGVLEPGTLRTLALMLRGAIDGYRDRLPQAVEALSQVVAEARDIPPLRLQGLMLLSLAVGLTGDLAASVAYARRAVADAQQLGDPGPRSQALALWVHIGFMHGLGTDEKALATALELEDHDSTGPATLRATTVAAINCAWTGKLHEARVKLAEVEQICVDRGNELDIVSIAEFTTLVDLWLGHVDDAARRADEAVQRAEQLDSYTLLATVLNCQAAVAAQRGREDEARRAALKAIEIARDYGIHFKTIAATAALAFLEVSLANYEAAATILKPLLANFDPAHDTEIVVGGYLPDAIKALVALDRLDEARPLVTALETNGTRLDRPWMLAMGARGRALLLAADGDLDAAAAAAQEALQHHDRLPMPFERARTQLVVGQLQRRRRRKQAAAQILQEALHTFESVGAPLWAARARAELARVNVSPSDGTEMTPTERNVAERAAAGMSNRDIAAELFLSPKTVEMNLSRVYRKLGIRSRSQLHARLRPPHSPPNSRENPGSPEDADDYR